MLNDVVLGIVIFSDQKNPKKQPTTFLYQFQLTLKAINYTFLTRWWGLFVVLSLTLEIPVQQHRVE